ncbi:MAG TPA: lipopolysaccharide biosynthesis protein [Verrucomicrobiae bacterium]|nr:lipopolysaccharide biosynthesis protein [Verrucomicrobiae bacterium]
MDKDLKGRSVRAGAVTLSSQFAQFVLQTGSTVVLARLLVPDDFGVVAMALTFTAFANILKDAGLSSATIQRADLTGAQVNTMFWINAAVGIILTVAVAAVGPLLAWFYRRPELLWINLALSASFFIDSLGIQHSALLNREMRFRALALTQVGGLLIGVIVAITAAMTGWSYWALVVRSLVTSFTSVVLLWIYSNWRPGRPAMASGVRSLLHFGANVTGFNVVNYFSRNFDSILVGRVCGAGPLGFYSRAYSLLMLPISQLRNPLNAVAFPAMSQLQSHPGRFRRYFKKYTSVLAFASMPVAAFLFICSDQVIRLLLGPQWDPAGGIFRVLAITAFIQPVLSLNGLVMLSMGQSRRYFKWGVINAAFTVAGFSIGIHWGPTGVAAAYAMVTYALVFPLLSYSFKGTALTVADFLGSVANPAGASLVAAGVAWIVKNQVPSGHVLLTLLGCGTAFVAAYLAVFAVLPGGRGELKEHCSHVSLLLANRLQKPAPTGAVK